MKSDYPRIPLAHAQKIGRSVLEELGPYVIRATTVGSVRRKTPTVGDIDLLVEVAQPISQNLGLIESTLCAISTWIKGGERQMCVKDVYGEEIYLDLFLAHPPTNYHALLALRTGPEESSLALIKSLIENGHPHPHAEISVKNEKELFELAGIQA